MNAVEKQKFLEEYKESLKSKTLEELKTLEQEVIKEADSVDEETAKKEYELTSENYKVVADGIRTLLAKQTVQWQFTYAMVTMYDFWDPMKKAAKIAHPLLDSTLRTLGQMQFTGYEEWAAVVAINKYFEPLRQEYVDQTEKVYDIAAKHNAIMDQIKLAAPVEMEGIPDAPQAAE